MTMHHSSAASLVTLSALLLSFSLPVRAEPLSQNCQLSLSTAQGRLEKIRNIQQILFSSYDLSQQYPDHPDGRSQSYIFAMKGSAVPVVMNSPRLMTDIGENIIKSCNSVGRVTFAEANSGWGISVGLLPDGRINVFKCLDHPGVRAIKPDHKLVWGEEYCSL